MAEDDVVFVGNKPVMNYVLAVVTHFNSGAKDVRINVSAIEITLRK